MVPLPFVIPLFQVIAEKARSKASVDLEEQTPRQDLWLDATVQDQEQGFPDGDGEDGLRRRVRDVSADGDIEPAIEPTFEEEVTHATEHQVGNDIEFEFPRLSPNRGRRDTRFRSFPSISTWSSHSSFTPKSQRSKIFQAFHKLWGFIRQHGDNNSEDEFIPNYRWLPILSGVTIPFSILLQIPGLTERWYVRTADNKTISSRPNPPVLLVANIFAMVTALAANICLILRFLEKRVKKMTLLALCLLSIHAVINAVIVIVFGIEHRFSDGFTYGQPFWLVVASTAVSCFTITSLIWDLWTTPEFSKSGSGLTRKQRSLIIIVMVLLCWITLGGLVFSFIMRLSFIDGLYFTVVSIETIGFGDIHPDSTGSRIFTLIYDSIGILNIALAISTARETIIESFEHSYRRRAREVAAKRGEYRRHKANERARKLAIERTLREAGLPVYVPDTLRGTKLKLNEGALTPAQINAACQEASRLVARRLSNQVDTRSSGTVFERTLSFDMKEDISDRSYEENYKNFRKTILREERREFAVKLVVACMIFLTFWLIGAGIFSQTEEWSYGTGLYFCFVAFSTIGYGDYTPMTPAGRSIFVVWALLGVGAMTVLVSVLSEACSSRYNHVLSKGSFHRAVRNFRERRSASPPPNVTPRSRLHSRSPSREASPDRQYTREHAKRDLEALPTELLTHARTFQEHIHYFLHNTRGNDPPPQALRKLLEEIAESEHMDARLKKEVMGDDNARKALFMMSYEVALRRMIDTAERAVTFLSKDFFGLDHSNSANASASQIHESHDPAATSTLGTLLAHGGRDSRLRFSFDEQRYMGRSIHMHPRGLASEPDLHVITTPQ